MDVKAKIHEAFEAAEKSRRKAVQQHERAVQEIDTLRDVLEFFNDTFLDLTKAAVEIDIRSQWSATTLTITLSNCDSWNEALPFFDALESFGFDPDAWGSFDDARAFSRTYSNVAQYADETARLRVRVVVILHEGNSAGCRRVCLGTRINTHTSEELEYKLVCGEEESNDHT